MTKCPNCERSTGRTLDWACPFCGYPLLNRIFRPMSRTFLEARHPQARVLEPELRPVEASVESEARFEAALAEPGGVASAAEEVVAEAEIEGSLAEPEVAEGSLESDPTAPGMEHVGDAEVDEILSEPEVAAAGAETEPAGPSVESMGDADIEEMLSEPEDAEPRPEIEPTIPAAAAEVPGIVEMTVEDLQAACEEDGAEAGARLVGTPIRVTGTVNTVVGSGASDNPSVVLAGAGPEAARKVLCVFDKKEAEAVSELRRGQPLTVQGTFDSCADSILVTGCSLVG